MTPSDAPGAPAPGGSADEHQAALLDTLRAVPGVSASILAAFASVPRHLFLPGVPLEQTYADAAVVTATERDVPTSSSSQPTLMARMLARLDVRPGDRVLEVGTGTGYNAALLAALGAAVTSVELQADVAEAARGHLRAAGGAAADVAVVTGDAAAPPGGPYDRIVVTAACWALPPRLVGALADGGILVAPLRVNGVEVVATLHRDGEILAGHGVIPCGFMMLRGAHAGGWSWDLGGGGRASADADLGDEGRGALDRLLATPGRPLPDPLVLPGDRRPSDALLWLAQEGDPLLTLLRPRADGEPLGWSVALDVLPASLLVLELADGARRITAATLHGGAGAQATWERALAGWEAAGTPGPDALSVRVEPHAGRGDWTLPWRAPGGGATLVRGAHRWTLAYGSAGVAA